MKKKKNNKRSQITIQDYIKAVKKIDREIELEINSGFTANTRIHKSKKTYDRKNYKIDNLE